MRGPIDARFWAKVERQESHWIWRGAYSQKDRNRPARPVFWYGRVKEDGVRWSACKQILISAPRMALSLTDGVPLYEREGLEACHRPVVCELPACVNPAHLYWGTPEDNRADRYRRDERAFILSPGDLVPSAAVLS